MKKALSLLTSIFTETLWPTRCVICDSPNDLLCASCWKGLPFIDQYDACPVCGAEFGRTICCECNPVSLSQKNLKNIPLDVNVSLLRATTQTLKIVTLYKDRNEQRLARIMALLLKPLINPDWPNITLTTIPARKKALSSRGFDHMALVVQHLAEITQLPYAPLLIQKEGFDQRDLTAQERFENKRNAFFARKINLPSSVLIVDDVFTTGATLYAAAEALKAADVSWVGALTFCRV